MSKQEYADAAKADAQRNKTILWIVAVIVLVLGGLVGVFMMFSPSMQGQFSDVVTNVWAWVAVLAVVSAVVMMLSGGGAKASPQDDKPSAEFKDVQVKDGIGGFLHRLMIWAVFHVGLQQGTAWLLMYYVYTPLGGSGFIVSTLDTFHWTLIILSATYYSWDLTTIKLNEAAEILYFNSGVFSNVKPGIVCLGLPTWLFSSLKTVDFRKMNIIVGIIKNGQREPFIVECNGFRAIFDVAFEVSAINTRLYLLLGGTLADVEKRLVTELNGVLYAVVNSSNKDSNPVKNYPTIDDLKKATDKISLDLMGDKTSTGIHAKFAVLGFKLHSLTIKDIENEDRQVITAAQQLQAQKMLEQIEMLSIKNTGDKIAELYNRVNKIGTPDEVPEKHKLSMEKCELIVQRAEKNIQTIEVLGGGRNFIGIPPGSPAANP